MAKTKESTTSVIYKVLRLLRKNVIKILIALNDVDHLKWKEIQDQTGLPTATLNRSLLALQEIHFISKEEKGYNLTGMGKLAVDGLFLLGLKMGEFPKEGYVDDIVAEKVLAQDIIMGITILILASIKVRGHVNITELEKQVMDEKKVIKQLLKDYEKDGMLKIEGDIVKSTDKFEKMDLIDEVLSF